MSNDIKDGLQIVVEYALISTPSGSAHALLNDAIGTNVGKGGLGAGFRNTVAAISIHSQAHTSEFDANVQSDRYIIKCYGGTNSPNDAINIFRLVFNVFQKAFGDTAAGGIVRSSFETGTLIIEQDTGYPYYMAVFEILTT